MTENNIIETVEKVEEPIVEETSVEEVVYEYEYQNRFKSWAMWVSVLGAVWTILSAFGLTEKIGITENTFKTVLDCVGVILVGFGIVNNPTSKNTF